MMSEQQQPQQKLLVYRGQPRSEIPEDVTHIQVEDGTLTLPPRIFANLHQLERVDLPNSLTSLSRVLFSGCTFLKAIKMPPSVKSIEPYCFYRSGITTIEIPDSVERIGAYAFMSSLLTEISFPNNTKMTTIPEGLCDFCFDLTKVTIPFNIRRIETRAFSGTPLERLVLPDSVVFIGPGAFAGTNRLQTIHLPCNDSISLQNVFTVCPSLFTVPKSPKMSQDHWRRLFDEIMAQNIAEMASNRYIPMNDDGQRAFDNTIPCKVWPHLFAHRPKSDMIPGHMYIRQNFWMSQSTFDNLIFQHLRNNVATLLETSFCSNTARRRPR